MLSLLLLTIFGTAPPGPIAVDTVAESHLRAPPANLRSRSHLYQGEDTGAWSVFGRSGPSRTGSSSTGSCSPGRGAAREGVEVRPAARTGSAKHGGCRDDPGMRRRAAGRPACEADISSLDDELRTPSEAAFRAFDRSRRTARGPSCPARFVGIHLQSSPGAPPSPPGPPAGRLPGPAPRRRPGREHLPAPLAAARLRCPPARLDGPRHSLNADIGTRTAGDERPIAAPPRSA